MALEPDPFLSLVLGRPVRVRMIGAGTIAGRPRVFSLLAWNVTLPGLDVECLSVECHNVRLVVGRPIRSLVEHVEIRTRTTAAALDAWARSRHIPLRLAFHPGGVHVTGVVAGRNLGAVRLDLSGGDGHVRFVPRRIEVGSGALDLATPLATLLTTSLRLPPLPYGAELAGLDPDDGHVVTRLVARDVVFPLDAAIMHALSPRMGRRSARRAGRRSVRERSRAERAAGLV